MCLRADAPVFVPSVNAFVRHAPARVSSKPVAAGDVLIQKLANALQQPTSSMSDLKRPTSSMPVSSLPAAGLFCPYCIAACAACAFHKADHPVPERSVHKIRAHQGSHSLTRCVPPLPERMHSMSAGAPGLHRAALGQAKDTADSCADSCLAFADSISDAPDSEEASTDAGGSEAWGAASDASDRSTLLTPEGCAYRRSPPDFLKILQRGQTYAR